MKIFIIFSQNSWISWIISMFKLSKKHNAKMNLNTFVTVSLIYRHFRREALLRTLHHPVKIENALKRVLAFTRKEVAKVSTPRENPRGDLIPPFSEIANLVLGRHRDKRAGGREHLFIGRVIGPRARRPCCNHGILSLYVFRTKACRHEPRTEHPSSVGKNERGASTAEGNCFKLL